MATVSCSLPADHPVRSRTGERKPGTETNPTRPNAQPPPVGADWGWGEGAGATSPLLSHSVGEEGGWGEGEDDTHPLLTHKNGQNLCNMLTKYLRRDILLTGW